MNNSKSSRSCISARQIAVPFFCAFLGKVFQVFPLIQIAVVVDLKSFGIGKAGSRISFFRFSTSTLSTIHVGVVNGFRNIAEKARHFFRRLEIELVVRKFETSVLDIGIVVYKIVVAGCDCFSPVLMQSRISWAL